jgi:hypothetical protein
MAVKIPAGTRIMDNASFPYNAKITADHPQRDQGHERWHWLCRHVGVYTVHWNIIAAFDPKDPVIYLFKRESDRVRFCLTWL